MNLKNIPADMKNKSIEEAQQEVHEILELLEFYDLKQYALSVMGLFSLPVIKRHIPIIISSMRSTNYNVIINAVKVLEKYVRESKENLDEYEAEILDLTQSLHS